MLAEAGSTNPTAGARQSRRRWGVTARALIVGFALTPVNVLFLVIGLWRWGGFTGDESLFFNTVAALFLLALLNHFLKWRRSRWTLAPGEILTIYLMLGMGTGLVCSVWDLGGALAGTITYPFWFATDENAWRQLLWPYLPAWLTVQDQGVLEGFYAGYADPYSWRVIAAWAVPAFWWATFVGAVMWVCLCLNSIVRRRWSDEERLPFPLTLLPVEMVEERSGLMRNKLWWTAIAFSAGVGIWNTLASIVRSLPEVPLGFDYSAYVVNRHPWELIPYQAVTWDPWFLGICYLMPLDLAFSLFFFDILWLSEFLIFGQLGWCLSAWNGFPYAQDQTAGGFIALVVSFLWLDRRYFREVLAKALGLKSRLGDDRGEAFGYRTAVFGVLAGIGYLWLFLARGG